MNSNGNKSTAFGANSTSSAYFERSKKTIPKANAPTLSRRQRRSGAGSAARKASASAPLLPSLLGGNYFMKDYIEHFFYAMSRHLLFITDHLPAALIATIVGFSAWALEFTKVYIFADFQYLGFLFCMLVWDAYAGILKQRQLHRLDPNKYAKPSAKVFKDKTFSKLAYYLITLFSIHNLCHLRINGVEVTVFSAIEYTVALTIIAAEVWSIQENFKEMGKKSVIAKIQDFLKPFLPNNTPNANPS